MPSARQWSLQTRLTVTVLGIVSVLIIMVAVAMSAALRATLDAQLSDEVRGLAQRTQVDVQAASATNADAEALLNSIHAPDGMLLIVATNNEFSGAYISDRRVHALASDQVTAAMQAATPVVGQDGKSAPLADIVVADSGTYRVTFTRDNTALVGLPSAPLQQQVAHLLWAVTLVTLGGLLILGVATVVVVRGGLRPLRDVAATAERVAKLKLDAGRVAITERVGEEALDDHTEIGRVGIALNTMLDHVDASLQARAQNEELMRRFVADASHELRTPLASIRGYSELSLRSSDNPDSTVTALERIQAQSIRMTNLVEDLLLLARLDEGQELVIGTVDMTPLVIDAVSDARAAGPEHSWQVDVTGESLFVAGDGARLQQVIVNLLANARTHTRAGTTVTLSLVATEHDVAVHVHDTGEGIDPAVREDLFARFSRADRSRTRHTGGTGLGLSIALAIAEAHGGTLSVASEPGDTTFTLTLPRVFPSDDRAETAADDA